MPKSCLDGDDTDKNEFIKCSSICETVLTTNTVTVFVIN